MTDQIADLERLDGEVARKALDTLPDDARVRVTRVLVYEGTARWVRATLNAPGAQVLGIGPSKVSGLTCSHEEIERRD